jgi:23S rRNA (guanosine2251-2'-O)-methyltransferase
MKEIVVVLHNIRSLHNVGSIFRTADAAGVSKIFLCGITPGPTDRFGAFCGQFAKVSLGAERTVLHEKKSSTVSVIKELKNDGYVILAVEQSPRSVSYQKLQGIAKKKKIAVVMGNEVKGLPPGILKLADKIIEIPMRGQKESLNVSVSFGIALYRLIL